MQNHSYANKQEYIAQKLINPLFSTKDIYIFVEWKFFCSLTFSIIASWKFGNLETLAQLKQINL